VTTPPVPPTSLTLLRVTGALLFFVSLTVGGKMYFQQYDAVAPAGTPAWPSLGWNVVIFSAFALHHSVLARTPLKRWLHARVGAEVERSLYVIVASVLFLASTVLWRPLPGQWYALTGPWWYVGAAIQSAGVVVTLLAARTLSVRELMGLAPPRSAAAGDALETRGLYGLVRHPIYFGWLLFVAGAPLMTSTRLLFAAVSVGYLAVAIPFEERSLIESFGEPYRAYRRQVRWRMLPGVY
jgi:protein-S-isoprenylcysteine O-methyltransferase Ste14